MKRGTLSVIYAFPSMFAAKGLFEEARRHLNIQDVVRLVCTHYMPCTRCVISR